MIREFLNTQVSGLMTLLAAAVVSTGMPAYAEEVSSPVILVFRERGPAFEEAVLGMRQELGNDFEVREIVMNDSSTAPSMGMAAVSAGASAVVLMDNRAILKFRDYQSTIPDSAGCIPSVCFMGIMISRVMAGLRNSQGISYEVPIVTAVVNLRTIMNRPIMKIAVVHRSGMSDFIKENNAYCATEHVEIVPYVIASGVTDYSGEVKKGLLRLLTDKDIDALWVPNDNALLRLETISHVWLPVLNKYRRPVMVGVEVLVDSKLNFGTFAVLPDHAALGKQAADIVFDIRDNGWKAREGHVDPPVSVYKIINGVQAKQYFHVNEKKFEYVDKVNK